MTVNDAAGIVSFFSVHVFKCMSSKKILSDFIPKVVDFRVAKCLDFICICKSGMNKLIYYT